MGKDIQKNLVGQPIFKQLIDLLPRDKFDLLVTQHQSDKYYKTYSSWNQLLTLLFDVASRHVAPFRPQAAIPFSNFRY